MTLRVQHAALSGGRPTHIVSEGDTLWDIAATYNVSLVDLITLNQLTTDTIGLGQVLFIPVEAADGEPVVIQTTLTLPRSETMTMQLAASPTAGRVAALVNDAENNIYTVLLFDSNRLQWNTVVEQTPGLAWLPHFSADGGHLAFSAQASPTAEARTLIYPITGRARVNAIELLGTTTYAWAPAGRTLVALHPTQGVIQFDNPASGQQQILTSEICEGLWWNPGP
jgi:LysM repeat protein